MHPGIEFGPRTRHAPPATEGSPPPIPAVPTTHPRRRHVRPASSSDADPIAPPTTKTDDETANIIFTSSSLSAPPPAERTIYPTKENPPPPSNPPGGIAEPSDKNAPQAQKKRGGDSASASAKAPGTEIAPTPPTSDRGRGPTDPPLPPSAAAAAAAEEPEEYPQHPDQFHVRPDTSSERPKETVAQPERTARFRTRVTFDDGSSADLATLPVNERNTALARVRHEAATAYPPSESFYGYVATIAKKVDKQISRGVQNSVTEGMGGEMETDQLARLNLVTLNAKTLVRLVDKYTLSPDKDKLMQVATTAVYVHADKIVASRERAHPSKNVERYAKRSITAYLSEGAVRTKSIQPHGHKVSESMPDIETRQALSEQVRHERTLNGSDSTNFKALQAVYLQYFHQEILENPSIARLLDLSPQQIDKLQNFVQPARKLTMRQGGEIIDITHQAFNQRVNRGKRLLNMQDNPTTRKRKIYKPVQEIVPKEQPIGTVGDRVRELITQDERSRPELASAANMDRTTLSRFLNNKYRFKSPNDLQALLDVLRVDPEIAHRLMEDFKIEKKYIKLFGAKQAKDLIASYYRGRDDASKD